jgi:hypothetical protein
MDGLKGSLVGLYRALSENSDSREVEKRIGRVRECSARSKFAADFESAIGNVESRHKFEVREAVTTVLGRVRAENSHWSRDDVRAAQGDTV